MKSEHIIVGIHVTDRMKNASDVQKIFTEYGCNIKTRLGLHEVQGTFCAGGGIVLLEMVGEMLTIDGMLKKLATQLLNDPNYTVPDTVFNEYAAADALFQANELMRKAIYTNPKEKERITQVLDLLNGFYQEKAMGLEYQSAMYVAAKNAHGRLDKLCQLDVRGLVTDQQLYDAEEMLKENEIIFMDGLTSLLNENLPEGPNHPTYKLLVDIKMKKAFGRSV